MLDPIHVKLDKVHYKLVQAIEKEAENCLALARSTPLHLITTVALGYEPPKEEVTRDSMISIWAHAGAIQLLRLCEFGMFSSDISEVMLGNQSLDFFCPKETYDLIQQASDRSGQPIRSVTLFSISVGIKYGVAEILMGRSDGRVFQDRIIGAYRASNN